MLDERDFRALGGRAALIALLIAAASPCDAQSVSSPWHWTIAPYGWLAGSGGTLGVRDLTASNSRSPGDVLSQLQFGAMGVVEGGYSIWSAAVDAMYVSLENGRAVAIRGDTGSFSLDEKLTMIQPTALWTVANGAWGGVDVVGGARYWNMSLSLTAAGRGGSRNRSTSTNFWDGIGGLRVRTRPSDRWHANVDGNIGAGASKFTWEAQAVAAYDIATYWSITAGYRYLHLEFQRPNAQLEGRLSGFALGFAYRQ